MTWFTVACGVVVAVVFLALFPWLILGVTVSIMAAVIYLDKVVDAVKKRIKK